MPDHNPTWENTIHNDNHQFGYIDKFAAVAHSIGYDYIAWNGMVYQVWADETGFIWTGSTNLLRSDVK